MRTNTALKIEEPRVQTVQTVPTQTPSVKRRGGIDLGKIGSKKASGKTEYPTLPDDLGAAALIAKECRSIREQIETLEGSKNVEDADLMNLVYQWYWKHYEGKVEVPSSVYVNVPATETEPASRVLVLIPARYLPELRHPEIREAVVVAQGIRGGRSAAGSPRGTSRCARTEHP